MLSHCAAGTRILLRYRPRQEALQSPVFLYHEQASSSVLGTDRGTDYAYDDILHNCVACAFLSRPSMATRQCHEQRVSLLISEHLCGI